MKKVTVAILLIVLGVAGIVYGGLTYTYRDDVVNLGPLQATVEREETIPIPPIAGGLAIAAGVGVLLWSRNDLKRR